MVVEDQAFGAASQEKDWKFRLGVSVRGKARTTDKLGRVSIPTAP